MTEATDTTTRHEPADAAKAALALSGRPAPGLHVVATPIGNLADVSLRALATLAGADLVACEDTRHTRRLLDRYGLAPRLVSYHEHNAAERRPQILGRLNEGAAVALVSDAGTPLVSDPGYKLVRAAVEAGHAVHAVPGPSAVLAALVVSGLPSDRFWFEGFLPHKTGARTNRIAEIAGIPGTLVFFESPKRLPAMLADLSAALGNREGIVARELTKRFETVIRGDLAGLAAHFADAGPPKGEVVVVVGPPVDGAAIPDAVEIDARLGNLIGEVGTREAAARLAAETGLKRRDLYRRALDLAGDD